LYRAGFSADSDEACIAGERLPSRVATHRVRLVVPASRQLIPSTGWKNAVMAFFNKQLEP
jgi:hypothetical protein